MSDDTDAQATAIANARAQGKLDIAAIAKQIGWSLARTEILVRLSLPELRRALRVTPTTLERSADEKLYPTGGWLGDYLLYCQESEAPLGWHFWCGVAIIACAARRNFYYDRGRYFLYLNHYLFLLGPSGLTKSTTIGQAVGVFDELQSIAAQHDPAKLEPIYQSPERITPERLLVDLAAWAKRRPDRAETILFVMSDELATLLGKDVKGSDRLANLLTEIYMGNKNYRDFTISGKDRNVPYPTATCLFASTGPSVRRAMTEGMFTEGFMARIVTSSRQYAERHGDYPIPPPSDPVLKRQLAERLVPWITLNQSVEMRLTPEAAAWFDGWYRAHQSVMPTDEKLTAFWKRKPDHILKLAGVLYISAHVDSPPSEDVAVLPIGLELLHSAREFVEDEERRLAAAYSMIGAKDESQDIARIQSYIERKWEETGEAIPHAQIFHNCRHIVKSGMHLREMADALLGMDVIQRADVGSKMAYKPKGARP